QVAAASAIVSIDYFGAQTLLAGLRSSLAAAAVAVCSNFSTLPGADGPVAAACLAEDEEDARRLALARGGHPAYAGAKLALGRWVRRSAPGAEWAGAGVRLNAVAPGTVLTPLLQDGLEHPVFGPAIRSFPIPPRAFGAAPAELSWALALVSVGSLGVLVLGPIADRFGRRRLVLASVGLLALFGAGTAMARTLAALVVWQAAARMFQEGALFTSAVIAAEEMPAAHRGTAQGLLGTVTARGSGF